MNSPSIDVSWLDKTILDGKLTVKQLISIIGVIIIILLIFILLKTLIKFILIGGIILVIGVYLGLISPIQARNISTQITANGIEQYQKYIKASDNIRAVTDKNTKKKGIEIRVNDEWVNIDKIDSVVNGDGLLTIIIDGKYYVINDPKMIELIKQFTKGNLIQRIFNVY